MTYKYIALEMFRQLLDYMMISFSSQLYSAMLKFSIKGYQNLCFFILMYSLDSFNV